MKIKALTFDEHGQPEQITFTISLPEAIYLALLLGSQSGRTANETLSKNGDVINASCYYTVSGEVFNRYWDNGVEEARSQYLAQPSP